MTGPTKEKTEPMPPSLPPSREITPSAVFRRGIAMDREGALTPAHTARGMIRAGQAHLTDDAAIDA